MKQINDEIFYVDQGIVKVTRGEGEVGPMGERLDVEALATELTDLVLAGAEDVRLRWSGERVQIRMAQVLPSAPKQTTEGRRRRLNESLMVHLGTHGWKRERGGWWKPEKDIEG